MYGSPRVYRDQMDVSGMIDGRTTCAMAYTPDLRAIRQFLTSLSQEKKRYISHPTRLREGDELTNQHPVASLLSVFLLTQRKPPRL